MHDIFNLKLSDVPKSFNEVQYAAGRVAAQAFMKTFCLEHGISDRVRLYYHYLKFQHTFVNFLKCKNDFIEKKYEDCYQELASKLNSVINASNYYPLGHWLVESSFKLGYQQELDEKLKTAANTKTKRKILKVLDEKLGRSIQIEGAVIVYAFNNSYKVPFFTSIYSFVSSNRANLDKLHFVVGIDVSTEEAEVAKFLSRLGVSFKIYNMENCCNVELRESYDNNTEFILDKSCYYRIFLLKQLIQEVEGGFKKALYVDSDTLVLGDVSELLALKMETPIMAKNEKTTEEAVKKAKSINKIDYYFNSGVILFDLANKQTKKGLELTVDAAKHKQNKLMLQDQCALNIGFNGSVSPLPENYNFMLHMHEFVNTEQEAKILHFTGRIKPWEPHYVDNPFFKGVWLSINREAMKLLE